MRYFNTSALVKQYFVEPGSMAVRELLKSGERVFTAGVERVSRESADIVGGGGFVPLGALPPLEGE